LEVLLKIWEREAAPAAFFEESTLIKKGAAQQHQCKRRGKVTLQGDERDSDYDRNAQIAEEHYSEGGCVPEQRLTRAKPLAEVKAADIVAQASVGARRADNK